MEVGSKLDAPAGALAYPLRATPESASASVLAVTLPVVLPSRAVESPTDNTMPGSEALQTQAARRRAERQTSSCTECRRRKQKVSSLLSSDSLHILLPFCRCSAHLSRYYPSPLTHPWR